MTVASPRQGAPAIDDETRRRLFELGARGGGGRFAVPGEMFESVISDIYTSILKDGDLALDGGANVGRHTFPMAEAVGTRGLVLAVEAIPALSKSLENEARRRKLSQVKVVGKALYDRSTNVEYHFVENNPGYSGIEARRYDFEARVKRIPLQTVTIDSLLREHNLRFGAIARRPWRFCKLDLEGGELRALQGARSALTRYGPLIVFENGQESSAQYYCYSSEEWFGFFNAIGYAVFTLWGQSFGREDWGRDDIPWYFIATPRNSDHARFVTGQLPNLLRTYLN